MKKEELDAYVALANGEKLSDPAYMHDPRRAEEQLKQRVRECWVHREHFPEWVNGYVKRWSGVPSGPSLRQKMSERLKLNQ